MIHPQVFQQESTDPYAMWTTDFVTSHTSQTGFTNIDFVNSKFYYNKYIKKYKIFNKLIFYLFIVYNTMIMIYRALFIWILSMGDKYSHTRSLEISSCVGMREKSICVIMKLMPVAKSDISNQNTGKLLLL